MDDYPAEYTEHNLPLILLFGLGETKGNDALRNPLPRQENGTRIQVASPECSGERARTLLTEFHKLDGSNLPWNAAAQPGPSGALRYKVKAIGRTYTLPPRKAAPLPQSPSSEGLPPTSSSPQRTELHSPLSPLSPGSPVFPDGVFTPLWLTKHQANVPALFLAFFNISTPDSHAADEQLKTDINGIKSALNRSGFRTRFAAILLSDRSLLQAPELEDRLGSIKRLSSLDSKTGLFFMPPMGTQAEIGTFAQSVMTSLQPLCVEYYRELTKHARRKKTKGGSQSSVLLPGGGMAQTLSTPGWNVRYEVKQGIFAEFRQEMDVAERHYSSAIDELFNAEGVLEATPSWSPRWEEARLLCDCLASRVLRCQLWSSLTTPAVQSWQNYKARMKDLVDRKGKGSETYGWEAWEGRWAEIMAQLIQRAEIPALRRSVTSTPPNESTSAVAPQKVYVLPDRKPLAAEERLPPWQNLHHPGYWLRLAIKGSRVRRRRAMEIPEEDRIPPGRSPASAVASRVRNYDCYLVPDPHEECRHNHVGDIAKLTADAAEEFQGRAQMRLSDISKLDLAQDYVDVERYDDAMAVLLPIWEESTWREESWHDLFAELLVLLRRCALQLRKAEAIVGTTYELLSIRSTVPDDVQLDLESCLEDMPSTEFVDVKFEDGQRLCPVKVSFAFESKETHVGESVGCQLSILSRAAEGPTPLTLASVAVSVGSSKFINITHSSDFEDQSQTSIELKTKDGSLDGTANLKLQGGQRKVFDFDLTFREAEIFQVKSVNIGIRSDRFSIEHGITDEASLRASSIFIQTKDGLEKRVVPHVESTVVAVLPKPPKVQILVHGLRKQYYTDELVRLEVEIVNGETAAVDGQISANTGRDEDEPLLLRWAGGDDQGAPEEFPEPGKPVLKTLEQTEPKASQRAVLLLKAPTEPTKMTLAVEAEYTLSMDKTTPLRKLLMLDLHFAIPFEVKFSFGPLLYRDPWPSYFSAKAGGSHDEPNGIPQLWRLTSQIESLATENLVLHDANPVVESILGESSADISRPESAEKQTFGTGQTKRYSFQLRTQKHSLDDRRPTTIESTLAITWSFDNESEPVTTRLPVPRLTLPVSEPRVLCTLVDTASDKNEDEQSDATLQYHIENPSTHFLTFALSMEATEEFAFSGPKYRTLSLAPLSRHKVEYQIALQDQYNAATVVDEEEEGDIRGRWIWPALQVIDSYYQKTLRIHPGGPRVRFDDKQNIAVFIPAPDND